MKRFYLITILLGAFLLAIPAAAQDNLLNNGGLEQGDNGPYLGRNGRADLNAPAGWGLWLPAAGDSNQFYNRTDVVTGFPHPGPGPNPVEGNTAANFNGPYVQYSAALYQQVSVQPGSPLTASARSQVKACNLPEGSGFCGSDLDSGAQTRVGIDLNGGTDPNAAGIVWSAWTQPHDTWQEQSVSTEATGGTVTVFLYNTQANPYDVNKVYWDDAKLVGAAGSGDIVEGEAAAPPPTATPFIETVPFVNAQGPSDDGSISHVIQPGDTLDSIAVAYGLTRQQLLDRNPQIGDPRLIQVGQRLTIAEPGTVDVEEDEPEVEESAPDVEEAPAENAEVPAESAEVPAEDAAEPVESAPATSAGGGMSLFDALSILLGVDTTGTQSQVAQPESAAQPIEVVPTVAPQPTLVVPTVVIQPTVPPPTIVVPTVVPPTPTEADTDNPVLEISGLPTNEPAPVVAAERAAVDLTAETVAVCVSMFDDSNQNRIREAGEDLLPGGAVNLRAEGTTLDSYATDGDNEPYCFSDLQPGDYIALGVAPDGYGLTTPTELNLPLPAGTTINIEYGAAEGVRAAAVPPSDETTLTSDSGGSALAPRGGGGVADNIVAISGLVVIALAGVVVIAGTGATLMMRRSS